MPVNNEVDDNVDDVAADDDDENDDDSNADVCGKDTDAGNAAEAGPDGGMGIGYGTNPPVNIGRDTAEYAGGIGRGAPLIPGSPNCHDEGSCPPSEVPAVALGGTALPSPARAVPGAEKPGGSTAPLSCPVDGKNGGR